MSLADDPETKYMPARGYNVNRSITYSNYVQHTVFFKHPYLSSSVQFGHVQATLVRRCFLEFVSTFTDIAVVTWHWCDIDVVVVNVLFDWRVCTIFHFDGSSQSNCTVVVVILGAAAGSVITCTFSSRGIFCTSVDSWKLEEICWAVKFANADTGIIVNCCVCAPIEENIWIRIIDFYCCFGCCCCCCPDCTITDAVCCCDCCWITCDTCRLCKTEKFKYNRY